MIRAAVRAIAVAGAIACCAPLAARADGPNNAAAIPDRIQFNRDIRSILAENCYACHGPDANKRKADLRLDTKGGLFEAIKDKHPVVAGHAEQSELFRRVTTDDADERMPAPKSGKRLTERQVALLKKWIEQGAAWQGHWAFTPPVRPPLPDVRDASWPRGAIDKFILAGLEAEGLRPSPEADKATLIRRVTLDLTGLPPTPDEVQEFLADSSPEAYDKLVDRLLANPHYGERMALDWLDASRFADTHGYHIDPGRDMTKWREWVINAFNNDKPFDQFTIEQLAGDLLLSPTLDQKIATGLQRNSMINFEGGAIPEEYLTAYLIDRVSTTSTVFLGLTLNCCQCHDHKYDPFTQKDFYQLYAFFNGIPENGLDGQKGNAVPLLELPSKEQQQKLDELAASMGLIEDQLAGPMPEADAAQAEWEKAVAEPETIAVTSSKTPHGASGVPEKIKDILAIAPEKRSEDQKAEVRTYYRTSFVPKVAELNDELAKLKKQQEELDEQVPTAMVMQEMPKPRDTFILIRGQYDRFGEKVTADTPAALPPMPADAPHNRLGLARWIVSPQNPLTARVTVNRLWQQFFGIGLVKTAEDFGSQGELPSHPELLDWLAAQFRDGDDQTPKWDIKAMVRLIVTSATYRQSSVVTPELKARDPENRLLARGPRFRLPAEFIRDQALAVSGLLNPQIGGKSVSPYQPPGLWEELMSRSDGAKWTAQVYVQSHGADLYRRSMYTFWKRTSPPPAMMVFDAPDRETCTVRRARTNTPLQALVLWNDPTFVEAARKMAERIMTDGGPTFQGRIAFAFRLATARPPSNKEIALLMKVFEKELQKYQGDPSAARKLLAVGESPRNEELDTARLAAWTVVSSTILNLDETVTKN